MKALKDKIIEEIAKELDIKESIIECIIEFQFLEATKAMKINKEIEFSGWGKFLVSKNKLKRKKTKLLDKIERYSPLHPERIEGIKKELETLAVYE